jgi:hypothetical protein
VSSIGQREGRDARLPIVLIVAHEVAAVDGGDGEHDREQRDPADDRGQRGVGDAAARRGRQRRLRQRRGGEVERQRDARHGAQALGGRGRGRRRAAGVPRQQREDEAVEGRGDRRREGHRRGRRVGRCAPGDQQVQEGAEGPQVVGGERAGGLVGRRLGRSQAGTHHDRTAGGVQHYCVRRQVAMRLADRVQDRQCVGDVGGDQERAGLRHLHGAAEQWTIGLCLDEGDLAVVEQGDIEDGREARVPQCLERAQVTIDRIEARAGLDFCDRDAVIGDLIDGKLALDPADGGQGGDGAVTAGDGFGHGQSVECSPGSGAFPPSLYTMPDEARCTIFTGP